METPEIPKLPPQFFMDMSLVKVTLHSTTLTFLCLYTVKRIMNRLSSLEMVPNLWSANHQWSAAICLVFREQRLLF